MVGYNASYVNTVLLENHRPVGSNFNFVGEVPTVDEDFKFLVMIDFWERSTSKPPVDMDRIGIISC